MNIKISEKDEFKTAVSLLSKGKHVEATTIFWGLYKRTLDKALRIQLIDFLFICLDPIDENEKLIEIAAEGISLATLSGNIDLQAYFMARMSDFIMTKITFLLHEQHSLKLAPGWIGFATVSDKTLYESLTNKISNYEKEIDTLLSKAIILAERSGNKKVLGRVLMAIGNVDSARYLHYKSECLIENSKIKWWVKLEYMYRLPFTEFLFFSKEQRKKLKSYLSSFILHFLRAAKLFEEISDPYSGYAYYNLANHLRTAYKFREANNYLAKSKAIAIKHGDSLLLKRVQEMENIIKARNKDIPNYVEGERRQFV